MILGAIKEVMLDACGTWVLCSFGVACLASEQMKTRH